ncbi:hypothetical protein N7533_004981 [Penicillium manginii]|jgi:hypothetical protein|uniref:uncharacterized protein n=1 Tax=Penicillium manginii TaxID=203109 RepID=UPI002546E2FE|nr:uncharacterized protein N7533_004981 [Penicillium manginii]KAJ5755438.1 hypothetical protein N7533_004981 [Penicillium manginii]
MDLSYAISAEISLHGPFANTNSYISSYTTGDQIKGVVSVVSSHDVKFDNLQISFEGGYKKSRKFKLVIHWAWLKRATGEQSTHTRHATPNKSHHQFQNLMQSESALPTPRVLYKNKKYNFEFSFQVLDILPPAACLHTSASARVKAAHLQLPPSLGDATISGLGGKLRDDFAPAACQILYSIKFQLNRANALSGKQETLFAKRQQLRIKPALDDSSLGLYPDCLTQFEYRMQGERLIYPKRQKEAVGSLSVTVQGPVCIWLPLRDPNLLLSQAIPLSLIYQQHNQQSTQPPELELDSFESQIIATTLYTTKKNDDYQRIEKREFLGQPTNFYDKQFPPLIRPISSVPWAQSATGAYITTLQIPTTLPCENFVPTFHSCLVSRIYTLKCRLNVRNNGSIKLLIPLIISSKRDPAALPSYDASAVSIGNVGT